MLKKGLKWFLVVAVSAMLIGCGEGSAEKPSDADTENQKQETVDKENDTAKENTDTSKESQTEENTADTEQEEVTAGTEINVYFSNDDATGFSTETVKIAELSAEDVLGALVGKGAIAADVKVQSLEQSENNGKKVLDLDFSTELNTYLNSLGTTGEYLTLGSICNTYLDAFGCEKIKITVNGESLATGHAEYPGYMEKFK